MNMSRLALWAAMGATLLVGSCDEEKEVLVYYEHELPEARWIEPHAAERQVVLIDRAETPVPAAAVQETPPALAEDERADQPGLWDEAPERGAEYAEEGETAGGAVVLVDPADDLMATEDDLAGPEPWETADIDRNEFEQAEQAAAEPVIVIDDGELTVALEEPPAEAEAEVEAAEWAAPAVASSSGSTATSVVIIRHESLLASPLVLHWPAVATYPVWAPAPLWSSTSYYGWGGIWLPPYPYYGRRARLWPPRPSFAIYPRWIDDFYLGLPTTGWYNYRGGWDPWWMAYYHPYGPTVLTTGTQFGVSFGYSSGFGLYASSGFGWPAYQPSYLWGRAPVVVQQPVWRDSPAERRRRETWLRRRGWHMRDGTRFLGRASPLAATGGSTSRPRRSPLAAREARERMRRRAGALSGTPTGPPRTRRTIRPDRMTHTPVTPTAPVGPLRAVSPVRRAVSSSRPRTVITHQPVRTALPARTREPVRKPASSAVRSTAERDELLRRLQSHRRQVPARTTVRSTKARSTTVRPVITPRTPPANVPLRTKAAPKASLRAAPTRTTASPSTSREDLLRRLDALRRSAAERTARQPTRGKTYVVPKPSTPTRSSPAPKATAPRGTPRPTARPVARSVARPVVRSVRPSSRTPRTAVPRTTTSKSAPARSSARRVVSPSRSSPTPRPTASTRSRASRSSVRPSRSARSPRRSSAPASSESKK